MDELRKTLKKYGWTFIGENQGEEGWDAVEPDLYVCSISKAGWYIHHQWSYSAPPFIIGNTAEDLDKALCSIAERNNWQTGRMKVG